MKYYTLHIIHMCVTVPPDLIAHVAVGEIEAGKHDGLKLGLLHHAAVNTVADLAKFLSNC